MPARIFVLLLVALLVPPALAPSAWGAPRDPTGDTDWLRGLYGRPSVTRGDVLLAAALVADDAHWKPEASWALGVIRARGYIRDGEAGDLSATATRGFGCRVFARLLDIRGGLLMHLTRQTGRYAYRELVLHGLIPDGPSHLPLTGDELAGLLNGATRFQENGPVRPPGM